jgi:4-azaleucine resistance transporter AzlC
MKHGKMNKKTWKYSFLATLPVMAGYIVLGIGFGILLHDRGYSFWWAILMSLTIYAGSMQYVGVELLAGGASLISTALMTLMVNARHIFYGVSMVEKYRDMGKAKPYLIFALTDETYSLVCDPELPDGVDRKTYCFLVSLMDQCYWVLGSLLGALLGSALTFDTTGIDFSMTALFVVIFVEQWEKTRQHIPALLGLICALVCLVIFGADNFLIPTMICIPIGLFALKKVIQGTDGKTEKPGFQGQRKEEQMS